MNNYENHNLKTFYISIYMTECNYQTIINNKRIYEYYKSNSNVSIETMNLILLDFIEQLSTDMTAILQNTFQGQLMTEVKDMKQQLTALQDSLFTKINKNNDDFIEKTKLVLSVSNHDTKENLSQLLNKNTETYIERLSLLIPKSNDELGRKIQDHLSMNQKSIQLELQQYLVNHSESNLQEFLSGFDNKLSSIQQPIITLLNANQEHITTKISSVKEDMSVSNKTSERLYTEMSEYLNKFKSSSQFKGACSEKELETILIDLFPEDEIINTTGETSSGDFILKRNNEEYIMFETKSYQTNVDTKETEKFIKDSNNKRLHSIMMSQYTGIVGKKPYAIEINKHGNVLVYLHHVHFSQDKIKQAVQIIDNMANKIKFIYNQEKENGINIDKELLDKINAQLITFFEKKERLKDTLKEQHKAACTQVDSLEMPDLSKFLETIYPSKKMNMYCHCGYGCDSKKQLSNHQRAKHSKNEVENEVIENEFTTMNVAQLKEECKKRNLNITGKKRDELIELLNS